MLTYEFLPEHREKWQEDNKQYDEVKNKHFWTMRCPKARAVRKDGTVIPGDPVPYLATQELVDQGYAVRIGDNVQVKDAEEEKAVCEILGIEIPNRHRDGHRNLTVTIPLHPGAEELARLKKENEELESEIARHTALKAARKEAFEEQHVEARAEKASAKKNSRSEKMKAAWAKRKAAKARSLEELAHMGGDKD